MKSWWGSVCLVLALAGVASARSPETRVAELVEIAYLPKGRIGPALHSRDFRDVDIFERLGTSDGRFGKIGRTARVFSAVAGPNAGYPAGTAFVVFRGTKTANDWLTDASVQLSRWATHPLAGEGRVHAGFLRVAQLGVDCPAIMLRVMKAPRVVIAGHSLGGAAAILFAAQLIDRGIPARRLRVITFGAPRPGDAIFADTMRPMLSLTQYVKGDDPVTMVPPRPYYHLYERSDFATGLLLLKPQPSTGLKAKLGINHDDHHVWFYVDALGGSDADVRPFVRDPDEVPVSAEKLGAPPPRTTKAIVNDFLRKLMRR